MPSKLHHPIAVVDVETTGLDPLTHEVIEFAVVHLDDVLDYVSDHHGSIDFVKAFGGPKVIKVRPQRIALASPQALRVNGYTPERWHEAKAFEMAACEITELLDGYRFASWNVAFDWAFVQPFLRYTAPDWSIDHHHVDIATLAWAVMRQQEGAGQHPFSLKEACRFFGIPEEPDVHLAGNGAMAAARVLRAAARLGGA